MSSVTDHIVRRALLSRGFHRQYLQTSVGRVHVLDVSGGGPLPPMVLLHGFGASGAQMAPLLLRLRRHVQRMIIPDLPGHGFSDVPKAGVTKETLEAGLLETLDRVAPEPMVLFGNSMGGMAAIRFAKNRPGRVRAMILCSPGGAPMSDDELHAFRQVFLVDGHGDALAFVDRLLGKRSRLRHLYALSVRRKLGRRDLKKLLLGVTSADLLTPDELAVLTMPLFMIWGQADGILPRPSRHFFVTHLPAHAQILEPESLGHSPYLESPRALTRHILSFLSDLS